MANSYADSKPGEVTVIKVNDQDAAQFEFHGTAQGTRLGYVVTVVQSDKNFIRVTAWTTESKLKKMKPLMTKLAEGVKELKVKEED
jgi:Ni,Fe-hydrogenase maturation factor